MVLDAIALGQLRDIARRLATSNSESGTSLREIVRLARELGVESGVTVDFAATRELGQPLIVVRTPGDSALPRASLAALTPREREVAALIADGLSNKEIARRLNITLGTVKYYVHQILD